LQLLQTHPLVIHFVYYHLLFWLLVKIFGWHEEYAIILKIYYQNYRVKFIILCNLDQHTKFQFQKTKFSFLVNNFECFSLGCIIIDWKYWWSIFQFWLWKKLRNMNVLISHYRKIHITLEKFYMKEFYVKSVAFLNIIKYLFLNYNYILLIDPCIIKNSLCLSIMVQMVCQT